MMKLLHVPIFGLFSLFCGCAVSRPTVRDITSVSTDTLLSANMSVRALAFDGRTLWFGAGNGRGGQLSVSDGKARLFPIDTLTSEIRSVAVTSEAVFFLNAGSPATLYRLPKTGNAMPEVVYLEEGKDVFYDSLHFFDDQSGIAMGDPMGGCFSVITTSDGGRNWKKLSCADLPQVVEGEAAFAASNSCLVVKGKEVWMMSGGKKARVFHSPDKGKTWTVTDTPMLQGETMTGIFTADFHDSHKGFIAGGNYEKPEWNQGNKARTKDGGTTWELVAEGQGPGYVSCVKYVPGSDAKRLVTVGATGIHVSNDGGMTWTRLSGRRDLYTLCFTSSNEAYAAGRNVLLRLTFH